MNLLREEKGSVTIYLVVIFAAMILFTGVLIDLGRIKIAQNQLRRVVNGAARSVLADYDTSLRTAFGLFATENSDCSREFEKYINANLSPPGGGSFKLLDYRCTGGGTTFSHALGDPQVMKQQILETMKYRAPVEITRELINKFRQIGMLGRFYDDSNEKRKSLSRVNEKTANIHRHNLQIKQDREQLKRDKTEWAANKEEIRALERSGGKGSSARLQDLRLRRDDLERGMNSARSRIRRGIEQARREKKEIEVELNKMEQARDSSVYDSPEARAAGLKMENEPVSREFEKARQQQKEVLQSIDGDIRRATDALAAEAAGTVVNETVFAGMGIDSATTAYQRIQAETGKTVAGDAYYERQLRNQAGRMAENTEIGRYFHPENISGNLQSFEKTGGQKADGIAAGIKDIFGKINVKNTLTKQRDEIYINEYALTYFSFITADPRGESSYPYRYWEAEYICYGGDAPMAAAISQLYMTRFALDTIAYFAFSKAPTDLLARTAYSLIMGAVHATYDTFRLVALKDSVPIASMLPDNPLEKSNLNLTYKDHLRLFLLLHNDEEKKLTRIAELMQARIGVVPGRLYVTAGGNAGVSVKMWFLPLVGLRNADRGPFGTRLTGGRCFINKSVEFSY